MRTSSLTAALAMMLTLAALPAPSAGAATQFLSRTGYRVRLDTGADKQVRASWLEQRDADTRFAVVQATAGASNTFGTPRTRINIGGANAVDWTGDAYGGQVVVWDAASGIPPQTTSHGVWFSVARPNGTRTPMRRLSPAGESAKLSAVAGNAAGDTMACWWQRRRPVRRWTARCAIRRAHHDRFGTPSTLSSRQLVPEVLQLQVGDDGRLLVTSELNKHRILVVQRSLRGGRSVRTLIGPEPHASFFYDYDEVNVPSYRVELALHGVTVAASENEPEGVGITDAFMDAVHIVRLSAAGAVIARQELGEITSGDSPNYPALATLTDGSTVAAFPTVPDLLVTRAPAGATEPFPPPVRIGAAGTEEAEPDVAAGPGGRAALAWRLLPDMGDATGVELSRYDGSRWSAPFFVDPSGLAGSPAVGYTKSGAVAVTWENHKGLQASIFP